MKTKFYWVALLASAAMIAQAKAGGHHSGGGSGDVVASAPAPARSSAVSPIRAVAMGNGGRIIYSGQRLSPVGSHSAAFGQQFAHRNVGAIRSRRFAGGDSSGRVARSSNRNSAIRVRNGNTTLRADWRQHVFAQRSAGWQRNWDRRSDHWWHGHRCHFFNGSWFIFDLGFYPWDTFLYPYDSYYGYDPYSYSYDPGYYDSDSYQGEEYYSQTNPAPVDPYSNSAVAAAQEQLRQQGYYRGEIDGILGPQTRRAIARYQSDQGLRVTGILTPDTVRALGLQEVASATGGLTYD